MKLEPKAWKLEPSNPNYPKGLATTFYTMNWKPGENMMELDEGKWILRMKHVSNNAYGAK